MALGIFAWPHLLLQRPTAFSVEEAGHGILQSEVGNSSGRPGFRTGMAKPRSGVLAIAARSVSRKYSKFRHPKSSHPERFRLLETNHERLARGYLPSELFSWRRGEMGARPGSESRRSKGNSSGVGILGTLGCLAAGGGKAVGGAFANHVLGRTPSTDSGTL